MPSRCSAERGRDCVEAPPAVGSSSAAYSRPQNSFLRIRYRGVIDVAAFDEMANADRVGDLVRSCDAEGSSKRGRPPPSGLPGHRGVTPSRIHSHAPSTAAGRKAVVARCSGRRAKPDGRAEIYEPARTEAIGGAKLLVAAGRALELARFR